MSKDDKKAMSKEFGKMAGMVRMADAAANRAEARAKKATQEWIEALAFADGLRAQATKNHQEAIEEAQRRFDEAEVTA